MDRRLSDGLQRLGPTGSFLASEVALLYKAPQADVERNAMAEAPHLAHAGHPWIESLTEDGAGS